MTSSRPEIDAVVLGSGPNGLTAAVVLARAGLEVLVLEAEDGIGGGTRTVDLSLAPGIRHDLCSAVHPMALASPVLRAFDLEGRGVDMRVPEVSFAQPLIAEPSALSWRDLDRTVDGLGADGPAWRRTVGALAAHHEELVDLTLGDKRSIPGSNLTPAGLRTAATLGAMIGLQGGPAWDLPLRTERGRALLTGVAAHAIGRLPGLAPAATAVLLAALGHAVGWPVPVGGSQAIADALAADLAAHGGRVRTGHRVRSWRDVPPARTVLLDTTAPAAAEIMGGRLAPRRARALRRFRPGDGAAKLDLVLSGPIPWRDPDVGRAATQHVGGTRAEMARAEAEVAAGRTPRTPMILVSDPAVADPSREVGGLRPVWAYAHVPHGDTTDPTAMILDRLEAFAPGVRDLVVASRGVPAAELVHHNPNLVGGDLALGAVTMRAMIARPTASVDPYRLDEDGWYLCSAATPPGPGVHGMSGLHAARRALRDRFGVRDLPDLSPTS